MKIEAKDNLRKIIEALLDQLMHEGKIARATAQNIVDAGYA